MDITYNGEKKSPVYMPASVVAVVDITPHFRRITLQHELIKEVGFLRPGAHFKLMFPSGNNGAVQLPDVSSGRPVWANEADKPLVRTYTVRRIDRKKGTLDVEFVLHGDNGPAAAWAAKAAIGDTVGVGIKPGKQDASFADWYLLVGDETALPAIAAMLEAFPESVGGVALLETGQASEIFQIATKSTVEVKWLIRGDVPPQSSELLLNAIKAISLPDLAPGKRRLWVAGEDSVVKEIRHYFKSMDGIAREELNTTVYWKSGMSEDLYQNIRHGEAGAR
ncbi:siderophore-interacting protein [Chitinophaga oryzae]|uniref:Siderophore-interacting protein n=1 Tax=Chitinophaga oryzae TaxID=2725414 RepID=A0ABX6LGV3_9BACT|nr:siderophore-interacting protein [Chitinophaga oryzae]QJB39331.1 siderophore-interacting protein [Chitinophaga oryzae]